MQPCCCRFIDHPQVGWLWECCSQWLLYYFHNDKPPSIMGWLEAHHQPLDNFETRYDSWLFLYHLAVRLLRSSRAMSRFITCMHPLCVLDADRAEAQMLASLQPGARARLLPRELRR